MNIYLFNLHMNYKKIAMRNSNILLLLILFYLLQLNLLINALIIPIS